MTTSLMNLKILLPFRVFDQTSGVLRIVAESSEGSFGLLPQRLDCVTALVPGILVYETQTDGEVFVAIDEGILVKTGSDVSISVRQAIGGTDPAMLRQSVEREFRTLDKSERDVRAVMTKLETGFINRFARLQHDG
ncbi:MAG: F0F1 ATP synthase subunit epsilon [Planctomycetaceae bacterium]|nr:F0F1 ATP synthase subunit epsilon [Planctomycetaceae bacterium]